MNFFIFKIFYDKYLSICITYFVVKFFMHKNGQIKGRQWKQYICTKVEIQLRTLEKKWSQVITIVRKY